MLQVDGSKDATKMDSMMLPSIGSGEIHLFMTENEAWFYSLLNHLAPNTNFAIFHQKNTLLPSALTTGEQTNSLSSFIAFEWKHTKKITPKKLFNYLTQATAAHPLIIFNFNLSKIEEQDYYFFKRIFLAQLNLWAIQESKTVFINCFQDFSHSAINQEIISTHKLFTSLHYIYQESEDLIWKIPYWLTQGAVNQWERRLKQKKGENKFVVYPTKNQIKSKQILGNLAPTYIHKNALHASENLPSKWQLFDKVDTIVPALVKGSDSIILLGIEHHDEFWLLAEQINFLRNYFGNYLRIFVRSKLKSLRLQDEKNLISAGATQVFPHELSVTRCLSLAESLLGYTYPYPSPTNVDLLKRETLKITDRGYLQPHIFLTQAEKITQSARKTHTYVALIELNIALGLTHKQVINNFASRRAGDIMTCIDGVFFILLPASREHLISQTLQNIFGLPPTTLFANQVILSNTPAILERLNELKLSGPFKKESYDDTNTLSNLKNIEMPYQQRLGVKKAQYL